MEENLVGDDLNETGCRGNEAGEKNFLPPLLLITLAVMLLTSGTIFMLRRAEKRLRQPFRAGKERLPPRPCLNIMRW